MPLSSRSCRSAYGRGISALLAEAAVGRGFRRNEKEQEVVNHIDERRANGNPRRE